MVRFGLDCALLFAMLNVSVVAGWTSLSAAGAPKVSGHACSDTGNGESLLLFGGLKADRTATNELFQFSKDTWRQVESKNDGPGPRMYAASARLGEDIFVTGGWDPEAKGSGGSFKDDVFSINTRSMEWKKHTPLPCGPVSRHTACTVGSKILLHTYKEGVEGTIILEADGSCRVQPMTGTAPDGISMCAAAALGDDTMVIVGGSTKTQAFNEYVYVLDTNTWKWRKLESRGEKVPAPFASACMATVDESTCLVFGGAGLGKDGYQGGAGLCATNDAYLLKIDGNYADWTLLESGDTPPRARLAASLNKVPGSKSTFLLTGGWDPATADTFDVPWEIEL